MLTSSEEIIQSCNKVNVSILAKKSIQTVFFHRLFTVISLYKYITVRNAMLCYPSVFDVCKICSCSSRLHSFDHKCLSKNVKCNPVMTTLNVQQILLKASVSHDTSEMILIC